MTQVGETALEPNGEGVAPRDVVFTFSYETYTDAVGRSMVRPPDRILASLLAREEIGGLLAANPFRWVPSALVRRALRMEAELPQRPRTALLSPLRWTRRADPDDVTQVRRQYARYEKLLKRRSEELGLTKPAIITASPVVAGFCDFDWAGPVTYFARDDWASMTNRRSTWPVFQEAYREIARRGVAVAAVSQPIIDRIAPTGPSLVVPNGVEPGDWLGERREPPAWFEAIARPRALHVGVLDSRVDIDGVRAVATARPDVQLVLLGQVLDPSIPERLADLPNVHVHGTVPHRELVDCLRAADVALVAHERTPLTEAMSPLKVFEYLAAGVPVVSIDLQPVHGLGERVILTQDVAGFVDVLDDALALGRASDAERAELAHRMSWTARHDELFALVLRQPPDAT